MATKNTGFCFPSKLIFYQWGGLLCLPLEVVPWALIVWCFSDPVLAVSAQPTNPHMAWINYGPHPHIINCSLDLSLKHSISEPSCLRDDKMTLVPSGVVAMIFLQESVNKVQLTFPKVKVLWKKKKKTLQLVSASLDACSYSCTGSEIVNCVSAWELLAWPSEAGQGYYNVRKTIHVYMSDLDDPLSVLPGVVVLSIITQHPCCQLKLLRRVFAPLHKFLSMVPIHWPHWFICFTMSYAEWLAHQTW